MISAEFLLIEAATNLKQIIFSDGTEISQTKKK